MCYEKKNKSSNLVPGTEYIQGIWCVEAVYILLAKLVCNNKESLKKEKNIWNNKKINSITCNTGINIKLVKTNGIFGNHEQFWE